MCRYPFGSGGKRVCTRPLYLFVLRSSMKRSRMKLEGRDSAAGPVPVSGSVVDVVIIFDLTAVPGADALVRQGVALRSENICGAARECVPLIGQSRGAASPDEGVRGSTIPSTSDRFSHCRDATQSCRYAPAQQHCSD